MKRNLLVGFVGIPGGGKTTQGERIAKRYGWPLLDVGEELRRRTALGMSGGATVQAQIAGGNFAPISIVRNIVQEFVAGLEGSGGVFVGYPRTIEQVQQMDEILQEAHRAEKCLVHLKVSEDLATGRLTARGESGFGRVDDEPSKIGHRMELYYQDTEPLIEVCRKRTDWAVVEISGEGGVEDVAKRLEEELDTLMAIREL